MTAVTSKVAVEIVAQKAIATLDEIKAKAAGAESAMAKLQAVTSGGFDKLTASMGRIEGQLGKIVAVMERGSSASTRAASSMKKVAEASDKAADAQKKLRDYSGQMQRAMTEEIRATEKATRAIEAKNKAALHRQDKANEAAKWIAMLEQEAAAAKKAAQAQRELNSAKSAPAKVVVPMRDLSGQMAGAMYSEGKSSQSRLYRQQKANEAQRWLDYLRADRAASLDMKPSASDASVSRAAARQQTQADRRYGMSLGAGDRVAGLSGKVDAAGYAQATAALGRYNAVLNDTTATKRQVLKATSDFKRELGAIPRTASQAHASVQSLSLGAGRLSGILANTAVVVQGFMAAFAFREILQANITMQQIRLTMTAVSGSAKEGAESFQFAMNVANKYGFSIGEVGKVYARFLSASKQAGDSTGDIKTTFDKTAAALRILGKSDADVEGVFRAFEQIKSKGTVMAEELRLQLGDRIPGAVALMAKAVGVSTQQLMKMMEAGQVSASYLGAFSTELLKSVGGYEAAARAGNTLQAEIGRLNTAMLLAAEGMGKGGFNDAVRDGARALTEFFSSASGMNTLEKLGGVVLGLSKAFVFALEHVNLLGAALAGIAVTSATKALLMIGGAALNLVRPLQAATAAMIGLNVATAANPLGILAVGLGALTALFIAGRPAASEYKKSIEATTAQLKDFSVEADKSFEAIRAAADPTAREIKSKMDDIAGAVEAASKRVADAKNDMRMALKDAAGAGAGSVGSIEELRKKQGVINSPDNPLNGALDQYAEKYDAAAFALKGYSEKLAQHEAQLRTLNQQYENVRPIQEYQDAQIYLESVVTAGKVGYEASGTALNLLGDIFRQFAEQGKVAADTASAFGAALQGVKDIAAGFDLEKTLRSGLEKKEAHRYAEILGKKFGSGEKDIFETVMKSGDKSKRDAVMLAARNGGRASDVLRNGASMTLNDALDQSLDAGELDDNTKRPKAAKDKAGPDFDAVLRNLTKVSDKLITGRVDWEVYYSEIEKGNKHFSKDQVNVLATLNGGNDALKGAAKAASEFDAALAGVMSGAQVTAGDVGHLVKALDDVVKRRSELSDVEAKTRANMGSAKKNGAEEQFTDQLNATIKERVKLEGSLGGILAANDMRRKQSIEMFDAEKTGLDSVIDATKRKQEEQNRLWAIDKMIAGASGEQLDILTKVRDSLKEEIRVKLELEAATKALARADALRSQFVGGYAAGELGKQAANDNNALRLSGASGADADRLSGLADRSRASQLTGVVDPTLTQNAYATEIANIDTLAAKHQWSAEYVAEAYNRSAEKRLEGERDWMSGAELGMRRYVESSGNSMTRMSRVVENAFQGMEDALVQFSITGKLNFADLARSIVADMIRMQVQASITTPLMGIMKTGIGLMFSAAMSSPNVTSTPGSANLPVDPSVYSAYNIPNAKGGAYGPTGRISAFAKGGAFTNSVVTEPTQFRFAKGGALGLMGEAGPEAIMPLSRGPDGSLGVAVQGGGGGPVISTNITVNVDGAASSGDSAMDEKQAQRIAKAVDGQVRATVVNELQKQMRPGGMMNRV